MHSSGWLGRISDLSPLTGSGPEHHEPLAQMELEDTFSSAVGKAPSDGSSLQKKAGAVAAALLVIVVVIFSAGGAEENGAEEADGVSLMGTAAQVDCSNPTAQGVLQSCGASVAPEPRSAACVWPTPQLILAGSPGSCGPGGTRCPVLIDGESSVCVSARLASRCSRGLLRTPTSPISLLASR
eukprot:COSAG06_NODE_3331_length_5493_cov_4.197220_7_plen_183_part_00